MNIHSKGIQSISELKNQVDNMINDLQLLEQSVIYDQLEFEREPSKRTTIKFSQKKLPNIKSSDIWEAEQQLLLLQEQNKQLKQKMYELESQKKTLEFQLAKYRQDIKLKKQLLNKEVKEGFTILNSRPRIYSNRSDKSFNSDRDTSTFLTAHKDKNLAQIHQFFRDVMKCQKPPPLIKTNKKYTYEQFMKLSRSEFFNYIHHQLPQIRKYFIDLSFKRVKSLNLL